MKEVQKWFDDGKVYADGVALYEEIGKNKLLLRNFKRITSPSNQLKLEYELGKFLPVAPKAIKKPTIKPTIENVVAIVEQQVQVNESKYLELMKQLPQELLPVLMKANLKFKENCVLKLQLNSLPAETEDAALKMQLQIDENWKENALCWKQIDFWLEHKQMPKEAKSDFDGLTPAELVKRQQYHFQNISKLKKRIGENRESLQKTDLVSKKTAISRRIAKQESALLAKEKELETLNKLVNGKE